jgi:hypothetical protein
MNAPHYDVVFATPGHSLKADYVKSLIETTKWLDSKGLSYHFISRYSSFVPSARENTATDSSGADWVATEFGAGKFTYSRIIWIDSDVSWTVEALEMLLSSDKDIISGMVAVNKTGQIGAMKLNEAGNPISINALNYILEADPFEVDGVGFAFLAVRQGVFENMKRPWFKIRDISLETTDIRVNMSEDYSWCVGAKEAGFLIWVHPLAKVEHHKEMILTV